MRRLLAAAALVPSLAACGYVAENLHPPLCDLPPEGRETVPEEVLARAPVLFDDVLILAAQAVTDASLIPCITSFPVGWNLNSMSFQTGEGRYVFGTDRNGSNVLSARLSESCDTAGAEEVSSDEPGTQRFELVTEIQPRYVGSRFYTFEGGCFQLDFNVGGDDRGAVPADAAAMLSFLRRTDMNTALCLFTGNELPLWPATCEGIDPL